MIDDHKLLYHPGVVARWLEAGDDWERLKKVYPVYVEISPFGACNFRCSFCAMDFLGYEKNRLDLNILHARLATMARKGVKSVVFAGEGEPLLHTELDAAFARCREVGLDPALVTNASVPNRRALKSAVQHCRWIKASVNAGTASTHAKIHRTTDQTFERIWDNLAYCADQRRSLNSTCTLGAQAVLIEDNWDEMVTLAKLCRNAGLDYLAIKPYSQHPGSITHQHEGTDYRNAPELASLLAAEETEGFKVHFRSSAFAQAQSSKKSYHQCYSTPYFWAFIRANGEVFGCLDFLQDPRFRYGNLYESDFDEIWEGEARKAASQYMQSSHDLSQCRVNCRMNKVNEYLDQLKSPSAHANFI